MFLLGIYILGLSIPFLALSIASTAAMKAFNLAKETIILIKENWRSYYYCNGCLDYYPTITSIILQDRRMRNEIEICIYWS